VHVSDLLGARALAWTGGIVTLFMCLAESAPQQQSSSNAHPASGAGAVAAAAVLALALARVPKVPERLGGSSVPLYAVAGALYAASLVVLGLFLFGGNRSAAPRWFFDQRLSTDALRRREAAGR
jgi:drug/metabolite transporter (DMT)-like permease